MTRELLSEVLDKPIFRTTGKDNYLNVQYKEYGAWDKFNIYELAHKCKEWADKQAFHLRTSIDEGTGYCTVGMDFDKKYFKADTEPEAIFKACEWILERKEDA